MKMNPTETIVNRWARLSIIGLVLMSEGALCRSGAVYAPQYSQGSGVLSYTFFNLSGTNCSVTPYGAGKNPYAYTQQAQSYGWNSSSTGVGLFNPNGVPSKSWDSSEIVYNSGDPITNVPAAGSMDNGTAYNYGNAVVETSTQTGYNSEINYPAIADSWSVYCGAQPTAIANMASAGSGFITGNAEDVTPFMQSQGWAFNSRVNPPAAASSSVGSGAYSPCSAEYVSTAGNVCGMGFTAAPPSSGQSQLQGQQVLNWNPAYDSSSSGNGGLWSGVNYNTTNSSYPASVQLNLPMLPVNLSNYTSVTSSSTANYYESNTPIPISATSLFGGHFTVAVGDPFLISSYASKALWFLSSSPSFTINNSTTISEISNALNGLFAPYSYESNYMQWLLGSQASGQNYPGTAMLAAQAYKSAFNAASNTLKHESVWGKVFSLAADTAIDASIGSIPFWAGDSPTAGQKWAISAGTGGATAASGVLLPDMNSTISNAFTSTTSPPVPVTTSAPLVVNATYASSDLFGLILTNYGVQSQINKVMSLLPGTANPFWSNYSIYIDNISYPGEQGCVSDQIQLVSNNFRGVCYPSGGGSPVVNNNNSPTDTYQNVYSGNQNSNGFSIWNALLTGSDVTTDTNGYFALGTNAGDIPYFSPPMMLWNATNGANPPAKPLVSGLSMNTTFSLTTGVVSINGFSIPTQWPVQLSSPITLSYGQCAGDQWATGGVLIAVTNEQNIQTSGLELACICVPSYLDGPAVNRASPAQVLGGVVVGATSSQPSQRCPLS